SGLEPAEPAQSAGPQPMIRCCGASALLSISSTAIGSSASCCSAPARGDAHGASDYDIAVFLKDPTDRWREFHRLADLRTEAEEPAQPRSGTARERRRPPVPLAAI